MHHLTTLTSPIYAHTPIQKVHFLTTPYLDDLSCKICGCVPNQPLQIITCQHFVCMSCVQDLCGCGKEITCPCNGRIVYGDEICLPSNLLLKQFGNLLLHCTKGCGQVVELQHLTAHIDSVCVDVNVPPPSKVTVEQLVQLQPSSQLYTAIMGLVAEKMIPASAPVTLRSSTGKVYLRRGV